MFVPVHRPYAGAMTPGAGIQRLQPVAGIFRSFFLKNKNNSMHSPIGIVHLRIASIMVPGRTFSC
jgi:hypothetical protein